MVTLGQLGISTILINQYGYIGKNSEPKTTSNTSATMGACKETSDAQSKDSSANPQADTLNALEKMKGVEDQRRDCWRRT